jgi:hypothetical protein
LQALVEMTPPASGFQIPVWCSEHQEENASWIDFFDWLGRTRPGELLPLGDGSDDNDRRWFETWSRAFLKAPTRLGLLHLLGSFVVRGYANTSVPKELLPMDSDSLPEPQSRLAALVMRLTYRRLTKKEAVYLADEALEMFRADAEASASIFQTAVRFVDDSPAWEQFLLRLHEQMPAHVELGLAQCKQLLRRVSRRRPSELQKASKLKRLHLPAIVLFKPSR